MVGSWSRKWPWEQVSQGRTEDIIIGEAWSFRKTVYIDNEVSINYHRSSARKSDHELGAKIFEEMRGINQGLYKLSTGESVKFGTRVFRRKGKRGV